MLLRRKVKNSKLEMKMRVDIMKMLYVCGSFKFMHKMNELERKLKKENIEFIMPKKKSSRGITGCLEKIDEADAVYVVDPDGYVGRSVCIDIGYAYAKGKPICCMHPIDDPPVMDMVNEVLSFQELISFLKRSSSSKNEKSI
jgi:nucleoside 2-deoxyribosyltransferase